MTPRELVETWVERFNAGDAKGLAELYAEDAVNHQVTQEPVAGHAAIRAMFEREFAAAPVCSMRENTIAPNAWTDSLDVSAFEIDRLVS